MAVSPHCRGVFCPGGWGFGLVPHALAMGLDCALSAIAFYSAGYGLRALGKFRAGQWLLSGPWYLLPVLFGGGLALSLWNGYVNLRLLLFGNYFLYYGAALCSILFYVLFSAWMARFPRFVSCPLGRWMACVGRNTLGILVLNQAVRQILVLALPWEEWQAAAPDAVYWMDGAMAFVVLWISFGLSLLLGKLAPWLVGKKRLCASTGQNIFPDAVCPADCHPLPWFPIR